MRSLILLFLLIFLYNCGGRKEAVIFSPAKSNLDILRESIDYYATDPNLFNSQIGIYVESLDNNQILYRMNEHKLFIPASNMKLFTSAVALLKFGANFRYQTKVFIRDSIIEGVLHGDVVMRGSGDPTIAARFCGGDIRNILNAWADSLLDLGINTIAGDIVGDESYFQSSGLGFGWEWDDEPFDYSAQVSALSINENCIDVTVFADTIGAPPKVKITPPTSYFTIENKAITMAPDSVSTLQISRRHRQNIVLIENAIPQNKPYANRSISVERPALFFVHLFAEILQNKGVKLKGKLKTVQRPDSIDYTQLKLAIRHSSPALQEIIKVMNKPSQNLYAEQLLHTLGAEYGETGNAKNGATVVSQTLSRMGISEHEFIMRDGSGLSRHNLISPSAVAALLRYMSRHKHFDHFYESLSIAGTDGTLRNRMKGSRAENHVHAKTGHVGWVSNLSGYITSLNGEKFVFSILVNNYTIPTKAIHHLQEKICLLVSQYQN